MSRPTMKLIVACVLLALLSSSLSLFTSRTSSFAVLKNSLNGCMGQYICNITSSGNTVDCVSYDQVCDGIVDCENGADEVNCTLQTCPFASSQYVCADNQTTIDKNLICNGVANCPSGDDEVNCTACPLASNQYVCADNTTALTKDQICNGIQDCTDGGDEANCSCPLAANQFVCADNTTLVPKAQICDGINDCVGGEDELNCRCAVASSRFLCADNITLLTIDQVCDGTSDCTNGDDETGCPAGCVTGEFTCESGECIVIDQYCDGDLDCTDGSDEPSGCICNPTTLETAPLGCATDNALTGDEARTLFAITGLNFAQCADLCCNTPGCVAFITRITINGCAFFNASDPSTFDTYFDTCPLGLSQNRFYQIQTN